LILPRGKSHDVVSSPLHTSMAFLIFRNYP
jgi:hypothetical protein